MELEDALLYSSITGLLVGCLLSTIKAMYKCKFTKISCCGLMMERDVETERNIEEGIRRASSGTPILTSIFTGRATI